MQKVYLLRLMTGCVGLIMVSRLFLSVPLFTSGLYLKLWWHYATFLKTFIIFNIHSYNTIIHSFILRHLPSPVFLYLHRFIFIVSMGCRAENRTRACITASRLSDSPTTLGFGLNAEALIFEASVVNMDCGQPSCKCSHLTNVWNISQT